MTLTQAITHHLALVAALYYVVAAVKTETLFFQQNTYRYDRYFRWLASNFVPFRPALCAILLILNIVLPSVAVWVVTTVIFTLLATVLLRIRYKLPLVITLRVRRLWICCGVLMAFALTLLHYFAPFASQFVLQALTIAPIALVIMANSAMAPIEKMITARYINQARDIIRSMPNLTVIGITGSYGKSSTKAAVCKVLSAKYNVLMTPGNFNTTLGVVRTIREHLKPYHQVFIVEMGAKQRGDIREICDIVRPSIGIITSVGEQHLESFKTIENIQRAKFELVDALPANGVAILNADYPLIAGRTVSGVEQVIYYGADGAKICDYSIGKASYTGGFTSFNVANKNGESEELVTKLLGSGNLMNITAANIVGRVMGVDYAKRRAAISQLAQVEHRLSVHVLGDRILLDDAYNSNPIGAKMALEVLRDFNVASYLGQIGDGVSTEHKIVITPGFVELGNQQYNRNMELGQQIAQCATHAVIVNHVNRKAIVEGLENKGFDSDNMKLVDSFNEAIEYINKKFTQGDLRHSAMLYLNDLPDTYK